MFLSTKAFFDNKLNDYNRLLIRSETAIPAEYVRRYKKNVAPLTPIKTGRLRRSIITQVLGKQANISWRAPYAAAQNLGSHTVSKPIRGKNKRDGGYGTIMPGVYKYPKNAGFAAKAYQKTNTEIGPMLRQLGLLD